MIKLSKSQYRELHDVLQHNPADDGDWALVSPNGPCLYAVSSNGDYVVRLSCKDRRGYMQKPRICNIREYVDGYLFCSLNNKEVRLHRLVAQAFLPDYSEDLTVNHKDGNVKNNSIENLEMMTVHDNCMYYHHSTLDVIKQQREQDYAYHGTTIKGRIYITNGVEGKMIYAEDGIPEGWW